MVIKITTTAATLVVLLPQKPRLIFLFYACSVQSRLNAVLIETVYYTMVGAFLVTPQVNFAGLKESEGKRGRY